MLRKVVESDPKTGALRERYEDMGPRSAQPGHGMPLYLRSVATTGGGGRLLPRPTGRGGS